MHAKEMIRQTYFDQALCAALMLFSLGLAPLQGLVTAMVFAALFVWLFSIRARWRKIKRMEEQNATLSAPAARSR